MFLGATVNTNIAINTITYYSHNNTINLTSVTIYCLNKATLHIDVYFCKTTILMTTTIIGLLPPKTSKDNTNPQRHGQCIIVMFYFSYDENVPRIY